MNVAFPRLRFRYTLRSWFFLLTAICLWFGYQVNWIRQRREFMSKLPTSNFGYQDDSSHPVRAPGLLWLFGEAGKHCFYCVQSPDNDPEAIQVKALFPEAKILQIR